MIHIPERLTEQSGFSLENSPYEIVAGLYNAIAHTEEPHSYGDTAFQLSRHSDMGMATYKLLEYTSATERAEIFDSVSLLASQADAVGQLFPDELQKAATEAYGELTTTLLWTFLDLRYNRMYLSPRTLPLRGGRYIQTGGYTYQEALDTTHELYESVNKIISVVGDPRAPVTRINHSGAYGMYRIGHDRDVLATIRLVSGTSYDPAIEYANANGTEASIGYSIDSGKDLPSPYKDEQVDPFSIRIDNEGDGLSLDVGSILGRPGTLGKRIADLIAVGDYFRFIEGSVDGIKSAGLNHNKRHFQKRLSDSEVFAGIAAKTAAELENRRQTTRHLKTGHLLLSK